MPATDTATTATAAETRAAGSRLIGFIRGAGGVIVDKLFDPMNFITKDAASVFVAAGPLKVGEGAAGNTAKLLVNTVAGAAAGIQLYQDGTESWIMENVAGATALRWVQSGTERVRLNGTELLSVVDIKTRRAAGGGTVKATISNGVDGTAGSPAYTDLSFSGGSTEFETARIRTYNAFANFGTTSLTFFTRDSSNLVERFVIDTNGNFRAATDDAQDLGTASFRFDDIFATNGTIQTSDETLKSAFRSLASAELAAAKRIAGSIGVYQWLAAIAEKGEDGARLHVGVGAQTVWAIMADEGLIDPVVEGEAPNSRYAFLCHDAWDAIEPADAVEEVRDEEGNIVVAGEPERPGRDAGSRFGIRPDQLALFLIAAQEARIAALEAA